MKLNQRNEKEWDILSILSGDVRATMISMVRGNDIAKFRLLMASSRFINVADLNFILRYAASLGSTEFLEQLCKPVPHFSNADILSPSNLNNKIALHGAIENGHVDCVRILLNSSGPLCGRLAPVTQLLFGEKPRRPIDSLKRLENKQVCLEICALILEKKLVDRYRDDPESREEVETMVKQIQSEAQLAESMDDPSQVTITF